MRRGMVLHRQQEKSINNSESLYPVIKVEGKRIEWVESSSWKRGRWVFLKTI